MPIHPPLGDITRLRSFQMGPSNAAASLTAEDEPLNVDDMIVDNSTDVFGDLI